MSLGVKFCITYIQLPLSQLEADELLLGIEVNRVAAALAPVPALLGAALQPHKRSGQHASTSTMSRRLKERDVQRARADRGASSS